MTTSWLNTFRRKIMPTALSALIALAPPVWARGPSATAAAPAITVDAKLGLKGSKAKARGKIAPDLMQELKAPGGNKERWAGEKHGRRLVQVIITSDADDPAMADLRATITEQGGLVQLVHPAVKALTVVLPVHAVRKVARHEDVVAIAPNRATKSTASTLEIIAGGTAPAVRTYTTSTSYSGFDGTGVGIAIVDSGVMKAHRNFRNAAGAPRVARSVSMLKSDIANWTDAANGAATSPMPGSAELNTYESQIAADNDLVQDGYGHGTHVASVAAGRGFYQAPDSTGIAPNATLYDVRVLNNAGYGSLSDALEGINWVMYHAREYNIRVMNLSLAASSTDPWDYDPLCHAVRAATAMGITVVVAGGNFGTNASGKRTFGSISSPANDPTVITVGALNFKATTARSDDSVTNFSSRGPTRAFLDMGTWKWYDNVIKPDLVAPGNKVIGASATAASSTNPTKNTLATLFPALETDAASPATYGQRLMQLSGTSVAAPAVAGAAAVLLQVNPGLTPPLVKAILQYTAQPVAGYALVEQGAGQLNLEGAIRLAQSLRTDIASAVEAGTLVTGQSLLAFGKTLPSTRSSTVAGATFNWSRIVTVGGSHVATGDKLFNTFQPIWDPRLAWASNFAVWTQPTYWSGIGIVSNRFPQRFTASYVSTANLLTAGVMIGDGLVGTSSLIGKTGLFTLTPTLSSWFTPARCALRSRPRLRGHHRVPGRHP